VFLDERLVVRWNLEAGVAMTGKASRRVRKLIIELDAEGLL
jgi:hypothetical protein